MALPGFCVRREFVMPCSLYGQLHCVFKIQSSRHERPFEHQEKISRELRAKETMVPKLVCWERVLHYL
jgi:hypothetical protein